MKIHVAPPCCNHSDNDNKEELSFLKLNIRIFILFIVLINVFISVKHISNIHLLWIYHISTMLTGTMIYRLHDFQEFSRAIHFKSPGFKFIIVALLVFTFFTLMSYPDAHVWVDEYTQALKSKDMPLSGASHEQQPSGAYVLSGFLESIFSISKMSVKMTGFIPILISLYLFQLLLIGKRGFPIYCAGLVFLFVSDPNMRYLALEGRPVAYGLMTLALCTLALKVYLKSNTKSNLAAYSICNYLFLNSVGMQPVLLLSSFFLFLLILYFFKKNQFKNNLKLAFATLIPILLFIPIQIDIFLLAQRMSKFNNSLLDNLLLWWRDPLIHKIYPYISIDSVNTYLVLAASISAVCLFIKNKKTYPPASYAIFVTMIIWPIIFDFLFKVFIHWNLNWWYYSCYSVLMKVLTLYIIAKHLHSKLAGGIILLSIFLSSANIETAEMYKRSIFWRPNWGRSLQNCSKKET